MRSALIAAATAAAAVVTIASADLSVRGFSTPSGGVPAGGGPGALSGTPDLTTLQLLPSGTAGLCLDGSPSGFYYRISQQGPQKKWIIHFEAGAYCFPESDCADRAKTDLGSSTPWPAQKNYSGILSGNPQNNPSFYNWNVIVLQYCDGGFWAGNQQDPLNYSGSLLYFRGKQILQASFEFLYANLSLGDADEVIVTGCSAGGVAVFLHLDWIRAMIQPTARVVGAPDSGFFLDIPDYTGFYIWQYVYYPAYQLHNMTFTNDACIADYNANDPTNVWKCSLTQYEAKYVQTPLFVMNSLVDSFQMHNFVKLTTACFDYPNVHVLGNCSDAELAAVTAFRTRMISNITTLVLNKWGNGAFMPTCFTHCGAIDPPATPAFWEFAQITRNSPTGMQNGNQNGMGSNQNGMGSNPNGGQQQQQSQNVLLANAFTNWYYGAALNNPGMNVTKNVGPTFPSDNCANVFSAPVFTAAPVSTTAPVTSTPATDAPKRTLGTSSAAGIGAGVGCFVGVVAVAGGVFFYRKRRQASRGLPVGSTTNAVSLD
eukprot:TRINITY_DN10361_c0_g2_i1.p2 TRINITY_DN10361_c0_g2~~TRINITY_DN10361_c0_g2_i1.p2  ORF type:complete len:541 (-),score=149.97 TRINITY_DN10361_c0_g2_i1:47-1669(-)